MYGPVPAPFFENQSFAKGSALVLLFLSASGLEIRNHGMQPGSAPYGALILMTNVAASGASKPETLMRYDAGPWFMAWRRWKLLSTACESNFAPSWKTIPWRSLNV